MLLFIPVALQAQAIGQVPFGARVFSTGFPDTEKYWGDDGPTMSKERRNTAIGCIERTFGPVREYNEYWGECTGEHIFIVKLESGDEISFVNGCLGQYDIVSPRFSVGSDYLRGGLRVGQRINPQKLSGGGQAPRHPTPIPQCIRRPLFRLFWVVLQLLVLLL